MMAAWPVMVGFAFAFGAALGYTGGLLGIGGGILAIPLLGLMFNMSQQMAQGTALILVLPAILMSVRKYHQREKIDLPAAAAGAVSSVVLTWVGARIALGMDGELLRRIYACFVLAITAYYFYQSLVVGSRRAPVTPRKRPEDYRRGWFVAVGALAGMAGGIFGVGGGMLAVPILTTFFRLSQTRAQALALTMIIPSTLIALATYARHGQADWLIGVPMAIGGVLLVPYGVKAAYAMSEPRLKLAFACMLVVVIVLLLLKA